ncbi:hypothetical protein GA0004736_0621 [Curtobacterium sp. 9128]|nr:hypothetical protein GA0004736_0621 [Curtobacterium sp. 9128]
MGFGLLSEWKAEDGHNPFPSLNARVQCNRAPARLHARPGPRSSCPPALTPEVVSMSNDTDPKPGRRVFWLGVAGLLVNLARLLVDLVRKD